MMFKRVALLLGMVLVGWLAVSEVRHPIGIENGQTPLYNGTLTDVRIIYNSPLVRWDTTRAVTIWNTVHVPFPRDSMAASDVRHEIEHVKQWHQFGVFGFIELYMSESWHHGYRGNILEQQARRAAGKPVQ